MMCDDTSVSSFSRIESHRAKIPHCDHMSQCRGDRMQHQPFVGQNRLFAELLFRVSNVARIVYARAAARAARVKACARLRLQ